MYFHKVRHETILINVYENANSISALNVISECSFKIEKPKLPKFGGNIREYACLNLILNMLCTASTPKEIR